MKNPFQPVVVLLFLLLSACASNPAVTPVVRSENAAFSIVADEKAFVEVVLENNRIVGLKKVGKLTNPSNTLTFNFVNSVTDAGGKIMALAVTNPLASAVTYDVEYYKGTPHNTSSSCLRPESDRIEVWPYPIQEIRITNFRIATEKEEGLCRLAEQSTALVPSSDPFTGLARLELGHGFWPKLLDSGNDSCVQVDVDKLRNQFPVEGFGSLTTNEMERLCEAIKGSIMHLVGEIVPEQFWEEQLGRFYARVLSLEEASSYVMLYPNLAGTPIEAKLQQLRTSYFNEAFPAVSPQLKNMGTALKIPSGAMAPTLLIGDHFMVNKLAYQDLAPARGDVVVFKYPEDESKTFVKRIIGLPGDTIEIRNKQVMLNGIPVNDQNYTQRIDAGIIDRSINPRDNFGPVTVPDSSYFVLGDNRDQSLDSRFWGVVKREKIIGKVTIIYWSWDETKKRARWDRAARRIH